IAGGRIHKKVLLIRVAVNVRRDMTGLPNRVVRESKITHRVANDRNRRAWLYIRFWCVMIDAEAKFCHAASRLNERQQYKINCELRVFTLAQAPFLRLDPSRLFVRGKQRLV